jgi:hypothetical protein
MQTSKEYPDSDTYTHRMVSSVILWAHHESGMGRLVSAILLDLTSLNPSPV